MVYVMYGWGGAGRYKIGCTKNIYKRYQATRSRLKIVAWIPISEGMNIFTAEREVHRMFEDFREIGCGEVFFLEASHVELINRLCFENGVLVVANGD